MQTCSFIRASTGCDKSSSALFEHRKKGAQLFETPCLLKVDVIRLNILSSAGYC